MIDQFHYAVVPFCQTQWCPSAKRSGALPQDAENSSRLLGDNTYLFVFHELGTMHMALALYATCVAFHLLLSDPSGLTTTLSLSPLSIASTLRTLE